MFLKIPSNRLPDLQAPTSVTGEVASRPCAKVGLLVQAKRPQLAHRRLSSAGRMHASLSISGQA